MKNISLFLCKKGVVYIKRIITLILCFSLVLGNVPIYGAGEGNIDSGGGGMGIGTGSNFWNNGDEGVRVSVINIESGNQYGSSIDYTNKNMTVKFFFKKKSKLQYKNGANLEPNVGIYKTEQFSSTMPTIISSSGNNINVIKKFFCTEGRLMEIADDIGLEYDLLIGGKYKLLLEPIGVFTFQGERYAMTATEVAMFDKAQIGMGYPTIRSTLVSFSHKNLPLAMFLETSDLGFGAWTGSTSSAQSNDLIIQYLGIGIVKFTESPPSVDAEIELRTNTEVITSALLSTYSEINSENPATVTFNIEGENYYMTDIVIPEDESQLVWCKWITPSEPCELTITVSTSSGYLDTTNIKVKVVDLDENVPPNPKATDRNNSFRVPKQEPNLGSQMSSASWSVWYCWWQPFWKWVPKWEWESNMVYIDDGYWEENGSWYTDADGNDVYESDEEWVDTSYWEDQGEWVDNGEFVDFGWFEYDAHNYSANLIGKFDITSDKKNPTGTDQLMKSGYGIACEMKTFTSSLAPLSHYTLPQTALTYFPEFYYKDYWRVLEKDGYSFIFKPNKYSTYNSRVHFTPIWYPDSIYEDDKYKVYGRVIDMWTPVGMLSINDSDNIRIKGNVYDDWHIGPSFDR